ncbi:Predicted PurR-regulated permease PerM [Modestobacter sp. DSM 44400]|uniref:AI-2E family transporter n=1 Tax=Modestobacter sp. DSM 44400 TaxID=1550230 RepID=UPI0008950161|nr:AI-2E family transporter [Modestobacter sp. DSM 44400]SDY67714.1 Predicted PurR-regulated permease PerM [Modestobacter sp. DSM 44400]
MPTRTILATIGLLVATALLLYVLLQTRQILTWCVVGAFFAIALAPVVGWVERKVFRGKRRSLATLLVFLVAFLLFAALITAFAVPLAQEGTKVAGQLPGLIDDARNGRGPIGDLLERTNALQWVQDNQAKISNFASGLTSPAAGVLGGIATGVTGLVTVIVLAYLMVLEGPKIVDGTLNLFSPPTSKRLHRVATDCAKSVTGYLSGNLLISVICAVLTYAVLKISGVPFAGLIALFVGIADLVPLVGATIGGIVAVLAGFIHSVPAGIAVLVFFVIYQQLENHLLQPLVFARTVKVNPLTVIIAILVGVELVGVLGALLAIPAASIIQVIARDVWDHRSGRLKEEPTVGEERAPALAPHERTDGGLSAEAPPTSGASVAGRPVS